MNAALTQTGKHSQRVRHLPAKLTIFYAIARSLFRDLPIKSDYCWLQEKLTLLTKAETTLKDF
ncbi:MAG: transposase domain-containing protein [Deltaproteobacteria bacterium]|nr:transposase domain-containing protein [Deltaproteobacteria bacterium]